jgi:uncharacterized protein (TIGR00369 family)
MSDDERLQELVAMAPFVATLGIELRSATSDEVRGVLRWTEELTTAGGVMHGGALMSLADTVGAICAFLNLPEGAATTTVESKTNFFRPLAEGEVEAVARPLHIGRRFIVVQTDLLNRAGKRVAQTTQTQAVLLPGP